MTVSTRIPNQAGLTAFFSITKEWGLNPSQQRVLLGNPAREAFHEWKAQRRGILRSENKERILQILRIYRSLNSIYSKNNTVKWLTHTNPNRLFNKRSPLEHMLTGRLSALSDVSNYLDWVKE